MLSIAITPECVEAALAAGELACPVCSGPLSAWGFARSRDVRTLTDARPVRPRRVRCALCKTTHVLSPSWVVPRRRDSAQVIGEALRLAAEGIGHRPIANRLQRPEGTVRGWLRAARNRAESLRACTTRRLVALDPEVAPIAPTASSLGDAVESIMLAARAWVLRFGEDSVGPWERAVWLTGGLLHGRPPPPA